MMACQVVSTGLVYKSNIYCALCLVLLIFSFCQLSKCFEKDAKRSLKNVPVTRLTINQEQQATYRGSDHRHEGEQLQIKSDDYEKLSETEEKAIEDNRAIEQTVSIIPGNDLDGNSQLVFVNLSRVVNDGNKTDPTRQEDNDSTTKSEGQILCGETNRGGRPSMDTNSPDPLPNRIVGGTRADPGEFPYQVRLNIRSRRGSSMCGGVIIDQRHILTAAHCMTTCSSYMVSTSSVAASSVQATIGDLRITAADGEQVIDIEKVTPHQQYSACSYSHNNFDIAILKTRSPMKWIFTKDGFGSVNRVCLPRPYTEYQTGENTTVSGWGVLSEGDSHISNVLNAVDVPIVSSEECKAAYGQRVNNHHVCAGLRQGGKDSCQGDSGGPLVRKVGGQAELVGIVSFGHGCAEAGSPGVYTKVSHYIGWIQQNL